MRSFRVKKNRGVTLSHRALNVGACAVETGGNRPRRDALRGVANDSNIVLLIPSKLPTLNNTKVINCGYRSSTTQVTFSTEFGTPDHTGAQAMTGISQPAPSSPGPLARASHE